MLRKDQLSALVILLTMLPYANVTIANNSTQFDCAGIVGNSILPARVCHKINDSSDWILTLCNYEVCKVSNISNRKLVCPESNLPTQAKMGSWIKTNEGGTIIHNAKIFNAVEMNKIDDMPYKCEGCNENVQPVIYKLELAKHMEKINKETSNQYLFSAVGSKADKAIIFSMAESAIKSLLKSGKIQAGKSSISTNLKPVTEPELFIGFKSAVGTNDSDKSDFVKIVDASDPNRIPECIDPDE